MLRSRLLSFLLLSTLAWFVSFPCEICVCAWSDKAGKDFPSLCCSFLNSCFLHRCLTGYLSLTVKMSHIFSCNFICLSNALHSQVYSGNIFDKLFVFIFVQALLSVLCPEQHNALNAFQWTLQRTPESLRTLHQPIHPRIIPVPPSHQVVQEKHRQFPTSIGQADLKNCRKY